MELLRICAMLMIVAYHIYIHCITCQLTDLQSIQERGNGWFCTPNFSKRLCILALIAPWGADWKCHFSDYFWIFYVK